MLTTKDRIEIKSLMQQEIIPAVGCTEPIAVSLCTARATEVLGGIPDKIDVYLSTNILKNAMGVGIPGTGMNGLPIAIALGALRGKSEKGLELLDNLSSEEVEQGKRFIREKTININIKENISEKLYIEVHCFNKENISRAIISGSHTSFSLIELNGTTLYENSESAEQDLNSKTQLTFRKIYQYATESPIEELEFILEAAKMNKKAAERSNHGHFGHNVSKNIRGEKGQSIFGDNLHSRMVSSTAGACDVRMAGAMIPVMSNSGSGNQGIAATLPVLTYAENVGTSEDQLIRALILSNLSMIYIKQLRK